MKMLVVIKAQDPIKLAAFYSAFGLTFVREKHGNGPHHHAAVVGDTVFEIYPRSPNDPGTEATRLGFSVDDVELACARAVSLNGRVVRQPGDAPWGRRAVVCDPEGHRVELMEPIAA